MRVTPVATNFATSSFSESLNVRLCSNPRIAQIIKLWITQSPNRVTTIKRIISRLTSVSVVLKVIFLLRKKLITKAVVEETIFDGISGRPSDFKLKSNPKSIVVLNAPTTINRSFWRLFLMVMWMIFFNEVKGSLLGFVKNSADVFTNHTKWQ